MSINISFVANKKTAKGRGFCMLTWQILALGEA